MHPLHLRLSLIAALLVAAPWAQRSTLTAFAQLTHYDCNVCTPPAQCVSGVCVCPPGSGGIGCVFNQTMVFGKHDVYKDIRPRRKHLDGWSAAEDVYHGLLAQVSPRPQFVVEVGTWLGMSASYIASYLKKQGGGVLLCVDTWLGAIEFWTKPFGEDDESRNLRLHHGFPTVYFNFLSNMVHLELQPYVVPFPVPSTLAAQFMTEKTLKADFIHIDASHEYPDVVEDIRCWWPLLAPGGIMLGDDYELDSWPGVVAAVDQFVWGYNNATLKAVNVKEGSTRWRALEARVAPVFEAATPTPPSPPPKATAATPSAAAGGAAPEEAGARRKRSKKRRSKDGSIAAGGRLLSSFSGSYAGASAGISATDDALIDGMDAEHDGLDARVEIHAAAAAAAAAASRRRLAAASQAAAAAEQRQHAATRRQLAASSSDMSDDEIVKLLLTLHVVVPPQESFAPFKWWLRKPLTALVNWPPPKPTGY